MVDRTYYRLMDMKESIKNIRELLDHKDFEALQADKVARAAFERYLEVLSEASRHIPQEWKNEISQIPWRQVADLGNHVRHAYHRIDQQALWNVYANEIDALEEVVDRLVVRAKPLA